MSTNEGVWRPPSVKAVRLECGHEVLDPSQVHYCQYISLTEVGGLADPFGSDPVRRRDPIHTDERQFVVVHQACELAFIHLCAELRRVIELLAPASLDLVCATDLVEKRIRSWVTQVTGAMAPLHTMRPDDFARFRGSLVPASGMESPNFRRMELLSGIRPDLPFTFEGPSGSPQVHITYREWLNRPPAAGERHPKVRLWISPEFDELAAGPTVASRFDALLANESFDVEKLYAWYNDFAKPKWGERSEPVPGSPTDERRLQLKKLGDALYVYETVVRTFRNGHLDLARKLVGEKSGTGGIDGVPYLRAIAEQSVFFPALSQAKKEYREFMEGIRAWGS